MKVTFYYGSGSPYAWRVWLALEHKQIPYDLKLLSFSAGDLKKPEFTALNPRQKVPVVTVGDFSLYESAAIVEYLEECFPDNGQRLLPEDVEQRAIARRLVREADQYLATAMEKLVDEILFTKPENWNADAIASGRDEFAAELKRFELYAPQNGFFAGAAGSVDFTIYPMIALTLRMERRRPELAIDAQLGPQLRAWMRRFEALPYFEKTLPPHWKPK